MNITFLSDVRPGQLNYIICVRVSRMWEFRGRDEENEIRHLDLVVIDQKGYSMYAEIPPDAVPLLRPYLQEGKIVYMTKITISRAKPGYRPVDSPYMIRLNIRTQIAQLQNEPLDFPKYTFSLTSFPDLYQYTGSTEKFLDVIGRVLAVSNAARVLTSSGTLKWKRIIHLGDLSGNMIELSLWGPRALEFQGESVYNIGQTNHVIAIFVGTSMKCKNESSYFLSGTAACRWYINENDIPEIKVFQKSLLTIPNKAVSKIDLQSDDDIEKQIEQTTCLELKNIDPFEKLGQRYECTVTITGLTERQSWYYHACKVCNSRFNGKSYECTKPGCPCTQFEYKYKIPLIGTDNTYSLEFMLFQQRAMQLIGKSVDRLLNKYGKNETPAEITSLIGQKFTFIIKVLSNKSIQSKDPSFEVLMIKQRFGRQTNIPAFNKEENIGTTSTSALELANLPPLVPITARKYEEQHSSFQPQQPQDVQYMEIEKTGILSDNDNTNKRNFEDPRDDQKGINNDSDDDNNPLKRSKRTH